MVRKLKVVDVAPTQEAQPPQEEEITPPQVEEEVEPPQVEEVKPSLVEEVKPSQEEESKPNEQLNPSDLVLDPKASLLNEHSIFLYRIFHIKNFLYRNFLL